MQNNKIVRSHISNKSNVKGRNHKKTNQLHKSIQKNEGGGEQFIRRQIKILFDPLSAAGRNFFF